MPAGTVLARPESLTTAIRTSSGLERPFDLWFIFDPANRGYASNGWECQDWPTIREVGTP